MTRRYFHLPCRIAVFAAVALASLLGACASSDSPSADLTTTGSLPKEAKEAKAQAAPTAPPSGKALLTFTRPSSIVYAAAPATVKVNGTKVADLWGGSTVTTIAEPGPTTIVVDAWSYPGDYKITVDVAAGQTIALEVGPRSDSVGTAVLFGALGGAVAAANGENTGAFDVKVTGVTAQPAAAALAPPQAPAAAKPAAKATKPKAAPAG